MTRQLEELSLADMVADALAQQGVRALVLEKNNGLEMATKDNPPLWIDTSTDLQQWSMLPINIRQRKANLIAMRFIHIRGGKDQASAEKPAASFQLPEWLAPLVDKARNVSIPPWAKIIGAGLMFISGVTAIYVLTRKDPPPPPPPDPASETPAQRTARLGRACDATRQMMWRGGAWTSMPLEGWTVELWLSRKDGEPIAKDTAISAIINSGRVYFGEKSVFASISDGRAEIIAGMPTAPRTEATIVFGDGYARPFFDIDKRHEFIAIAEQLVTQTKADWGALYAHCAHLTARDVGAWFFGTDPGKAAAAIIHTMGKPVGAKGNDFVPVGKNFEEIGLATRRLDEIKFFGLVYQDAARTNNKGGIFVTFPFVSPVNAPQSSKRVATEVGL